MPAAPANLDDLPVVKGFRQRGMEMTRIETFTDAAFAFALTLLVVSLDMPTSFDELLAAMKGVPAFALAAVLLMVFWHAHHAWSRRFGLDDGPTIILSTLLVFIMLVYVFPLKFMTMGMMMWAGSLMGLVSREAMGEYVESSDQINLMFEIYGAGFVAMCLAIVLLNLHGWRCREDLRLNALEQHETRAEIGAWLILSGAGLLSIIIALVTPPTWFGLPGWAYMTLPIAMPLYARSMNRRRNAIPATSSA